MTGLGALRNTMNIHEYQAKEILRKYAVQTPRGVACFSVDEAVEAAQKLGGDLWVVKAQIHAGGRGKGGGVKIARTIDEVRDHATDILGMQLVTHQTGAKGQTVRRVLIEEGIDIAAEIYVGIVIDRSTQSAVMLASSEGGMEIEAVAADTPEKIHQIVIDPVSGISDDEAASLARHVGIPDASIAACSGFFKGLYQAFWDTDSSLAEINPLVVTSDGQVLALDAKITFDDNALSRHPELMVYRDIDEEDDDEIDAAEVGLSYIALDGNIGCLVNGAGLAMATMDIIKFHGGEPANFLDVGGGASTEQVAAAFKIMLKNPELKAILVNIFGGIMRCDVIAEGLVAAAREISLSVPLVVRLEGTNVRQGQRIIADSGLAIVTADSMGDAAARVVSAAASH